MAESLSFRARKQKELEELDRVRQPEPDDASSKWKIRLPGLTGTSHSNTRGARSLRKTPSAVQLHKERTRRATRTSKSHPGSQDLSMVPENSTSSSTDIAIEETPPLLSEQTIERLAFSSSQSSLATRSQAELAQAILRLRAQNKDLGSENKALRNDKIPSRTSSGLKGKNLDSLTITRSLWSQKEEELAGAVEEIKRLEAELQRERAKSADLEKARKEAAKALALVTRTDPSAFDDDHFKEQVENFQWKVAHWVRNQKWKVSNKGTSSHSKLARDTYSYFEATCPRFGDYLEYLSSKRGMEILVEAHLWQFLVTEIFGKNLWAVAEEGKFEGTESKTGNPFADWKTYLEQSVDGDQAELIHAWRVASARLMAARKSPKVKLAILDAPVDLVLDFDDELKQLATGVIDLKKLEILCHEAVQLDAVMQQQRPHYFFYPIIKSKWKLDFSSASMEVYGDDGKIAAPADGHPLKLVLRPSFLKQGNTAGKNYKQVISILKMLVELKRH